MTMKLKPLLSVLLIGGILSCIPLMTKAQQLNFGSTVTINIGGTNYDFLVIPPPFTLSTVNPNYQLETDGLFYFNQQTNYGTVLPAGFTSFGNFSAAAGYGLSLTQAPLDAGLSLMLGAGALAGIRRYRQNAKAKAIMA